MTEDYNPLIIDVSNGNAHNMKNIGPRNGMIYGELTKYGLVHAWADPDKSQYSNAEVLVIDHSFVTSYVHNFNRATGAHDWPDHAGVTFSVPLINDSDPLRLATLNDLIRGKDPQDRERIARSYQRVTRSLATFATMRNQYDALHQTALMKNPSVHENCAQLYPYAGQLIGPRVNVDEMLRAGVPFHPAVAEALAIAPEMTE